MKNQANIQTNEVPTLDLLTAPELAARLRVTVRTIRNLQSRRMIPFVKLGKAVRFCPVAVAKALQSRTVQAFTA
jgi:excisionase family DNA binding protein